MVNVWNGDGRMKVIVYTPPEAIENEIAIVSELMDAGADYLYIRKPSLDDYSLVDYVEMIRPEYYPKIITASLIITKEFDLGGYHFTRDAVLKNLHYNEKILTWMRINNKRASISAHSIEELSNYTGKYDHVIASPVFASISKEGHAYSWNLDVLKQVIHASRSSEKDANALNTILFAVGGIDESKLDEVRQTGFGGIGLLGALWNQPGNAVEKFRKIRVAVND
jgi:thiamine-phosphate pyrophosphorylase